MRQIGPRRKKRKRPALSSCRRVEPVAPPRRTAPTIHRPNQDTTECPRGGASVHGRTPYVFSRGQFAPRSRTRGPETGRVAELVEESCVRGRETPLNELLRFHPFHRRTADRPRLAVPQPAPKELQPDGPRWIFV